MIRAGRFALCPSRPRLAGWISGALGSGFIQWTTQLLARFAGRFRIPSFCVFVPQECRVAPEKRAVVLPNFVCFGNLGGCDGARFFGSETVACCPGRGTSNLKNARYFSISFASSHAEILSPKLAVEKTARAQLFRTQKASSFSSGTTQKRMCAGFLQTEPEPAGFERRSSQLDNRLHVRRAGMPESGAPTLDASGWPSADSVRVASDGITAIRDYLRNHDDHGTYSSIHAWFIGAVPCVIRRAQWDVVLKL